MLKDNRHEHALCWLLILNDISLYHPLNRPLTISCISLDHYQLRALCSQSFCFLYISACQRLPCVQSLNAGGYLAKINMNVTYSLFKKSSLFKKFLFVFFCLVYWLIWVTPWIICKQVPHFEYGKACLSLWHYTRVYHIQAAQTNHNVLHLQWIIW